MLGSVYKKINKGWVLEKKCVITVPKIKTRLVE